MRITRSIICVALFGLLVAVSSQISYGQEQKNRAQVALEAADKNGDGKVTKDEFRGPEMLFGIFDINKNGYLDLADFEAALFPPKDVVAKVGPNVDDKTLLKMLKEGGLVIAFRHGLSVRKGKDVRPFVFYDCSKQRNLRDEGRKELKEVAASIRALDLSVNKVETSPLCRTRETAWLLFGQVTPNQDLIARGPKGKKIRQQWAGTKPPEGTINIMVSHGSLLREIVWIGTNPANLKEIPGLDEGNAFIIKPLGNSRYEFLALFKPEDWHRLKRLAE